MKTQDKKQQREEILKRVLSCDQGLDGIDIQTAGARRLWRQRQKREVDVRCPGVNAGKEHLQHCLTPRELGAGRQAADRHT